MTTLILNPFAIDAPLISYDRIQAMGNDMLYLEIFDTCLDHSFDTAALDALAAKAADLTDNDPGQHWYDNMRVGTPVIKKVKKADAHRVDELVLAYLGEYLKACRACPACDETAKRAKARLYSEGLLTNGGPATDPVKKQLGDEKAARFFRRILFATDKE